jgi:hypothetical protein
MPSTVGKTICISLVVAVPIATIILSPAKAQTQTGAWCALYQGGNQDCSFSTFEQCRQSSSGLGGTCVQNSTTPPPPNLLQRLWQDRQQDTVPPDTWVPPPPNSGD